MTSRQRWAGAAAVVAAALGIAASPGVDAQAAQPTRPHVAVAISQPAWVTGWGTSQQTLGAALVTNATVRTIARVTIPGQAIRIRLDNTFGTEPLVVGRATAGLRTQGAALAAGSNRPITFGGAAGVTIPPAGTIWSDTIALPVSAQQDVAISLYIPGQQVRPSQHTNAVVTSYRSVDGSGDVAGDESRAPFTATLTSFWWLKAIDVETVATTRAVVTFGDSITDGTCTTLDAHDRWEDLLSIRLGLAQDAAAAGTRPAQTSIVNEGIGGNTVTREGLMPPPDSPPGLERFERDVLSHHGVRDIVVFMGTNDIRRGASAGAVIAGLATISKQIAAAGLRSIGVTIIPRHNVPTTADNSGWNDQKTRTRREVNQWIRSRGSFDRLIDFDAVIRDSAEPDRMQARFNCGDGIHPSPAGYFAMGRSVDLGLFRRP